MRKNFDIASIRKRLNETNGKKYWRSLEEIAETEEFQDFLKHEFPAGADQWLNPVGRRNFLKLMAASFALGGLAACSPTRGEKIVPYVREPEKIVSGKPLFFATSMELSGAALGLIAESHMGRPTKIDGNPDHPANLGGTDVFAQASVLNLYDPDRAQAIKQAGLVSSWPAFFDALTRELETVRANQGAGLRILTQAITAPSVIDQMESILQDFPQAQWIQYEPINRDSAREGANLAFGEDVNTIYRFDQADVVVSLDANFTQFGPANVRYAREFTDRRRVRENRTEMNRLYVAESTPSATGTFADHRLPLSSVQIESFARALAAELGVGVESPPEGSLSEVPEDWIPAIARDLQANTGRSIIIPGDYQSPAVHALAHAMNDLLGNIGRTVVYTEPLESGSVGQTESLIELANDMANDRVETIIIIEANPIYDAPADLRFAENLRRVPFRVYQGLYENETSVLCEWQIPLSHYLETWNDPRAFDGTVSLTQPLVEPFYDSRSPQQMLAAVLGSSTASTYDIVREYWSNELDTDNFEETWQKALHDGFLPDTELPGIEVSADVGQLPAAPEPESGNLEISFRPDSSVWDGRFGNNGWLQELPKPVSKLTWGNAAILSPVLAEQLGVVSEDLVELEYRGRSIVAPVWVQPGQAPNTVTVALGYGHSSIGQVGNGVGFNAYEIRTSDNPWSGLGLEVRPGGGQLRLASTQTHYNMEGRELVRTGTVEHFREDPEFIHHGEHHDLSELSLYPGWTYDSYAWGMAVDLNTCNGCNACVVACQSENNIPVVGKEQVLVGREMHWMRIDSYFEGELENPDMMNQPMMCQHCEQAPCELVCPVNATVHDAEGLNVMVYNRCIGTRYCSNNCPYKVRRFNFLQYSDQTTESLKGQRNPDVTVRVRGVMEKCTFCVQRISNARITAKVEGRRIQDGEVVTACQAACPTKAIVFGDINDPNSEVSQWKAEPHNYEILAELGTRPRTSYLAKLRNPNPELEEPTAGEEGHG